MAEYWVVDLTEGRVVVQRVETERGPAAYAITEHRDGTLTPLVAPDLAVPVAELLAG